MELFVYSWFYTGYTLYGHCLDDLGKYKLLKVLDYLPSCFVEGDTVPKSTVAPVKAEYKRMLSSKDVSSLRSFYRLYFQNMADLERFSKEQKTYMADIPQVTMFLSQVEADHVGWVRIDNVRQHSTLQIKMSDITGIPDKIPPNNVDILSFDIEVRSMDSGMPQPHRILDTVEMISVVTNSRTFILHSTSGLQLDNVTSIECQDEMDLITKFFTLINSENPTIITGYNIYGFDLHYLVSRLKLRLAEIPNIARGIKDSVNVIRVDWSSDAYGHNSYDRLVIGGRVIIDMYLYFKRMKLDKYSLEFVSNKFLNEGKNDMPYKEMAAAFKSGDLEALVQVAKYCIKDSVLVMRLFCKVQMWIDACEIAKITKCSIEDIYTRGEQMKMVSQCVVECAKRNIVLQPQPMSEWSQYEGAYVLDPDKGVYDECSILDFQSLYPSIIIAYNICPSTYVKRSFLEVHRVGNHMFRQSPVGLLPGMIKQILEERKSVKVSMKEMNDKTTIEYIVLDRRQNALKICANSVYGMMGFKNSRYFGHLGCAESVTTVGRELLNDIVHKIEESYPVHVIYGDSVTGYTPTLLRISKTYVCIEAFENIAKRWGSTTWTGSDKESCELHDVEVWTEQGWTKVYRIIRHELQPHKKIIRITTHTGICDVTDEHSLLNADGNPMNVHDAKVGDMLLHCEYPTMHKDMMVNLCMQSECETISQVVIASFAMLASNIGYNVSFNTVADMLQLTVTKDDHCRNPNAIKTKHTIQYTGYVYDLTTANCHFQAGPGNIIVHNTDSVLLWHKNTTDKESNVMLAKSICDDITASLPVPMALAFETYCDKVVLLTKKRYILVKGDKISYKGVMNARRDYCAYAKQTYSNTMEMVAKSIKNDQIAKYIDIQILKLLSGKVDTRELIVTKSLAKNIGSYKVNQPHVVLARRLIQKTGIEIPAGTRLEYIYVAGDTKMVTPEEFHNADITFKINGKFYVEKQLATQIDDILSIIGMGRYITDTWVKPQKA